MRKIFIVFFCTFSTLIANAQFGYPYTSFGNTGYVTTDLNPGANLYGERGVDIFMQPDGKLVSLIGINGFGFSRRHTDGSLDISYGNNGYTEQFVVPLDFPAAVMQPDGKVILCISASGGYVRLVRFDLNGQRDNSFGTNGQVFILIDGGFTATGIALQSDGKIVVGGNSSFLVSAARFLSDGTLDLGFGNNGKATAPIGGSYNAQAFAIAIQPDGKIVLGGHAYTTNWNFGLVRFTSDGTVDNSFGLNGIQVSDFGSNERIQALAVQQSGKILAFGQTSPGIIVRYNDDGTLDQTFGTAGKITTGFGNEYLVRPIIKDDQIFVIGTNAINSDDIAIEKYLADGTSDPSFGTDGKFSMNFSTDEGRSAVIQNDGKLMLLGNVKYQGYPWTYNLLRVNSNGTLDNSFGTNGSSSSYYYGGNSQFRRIVIQADGKIIAGGYTNSPTVDLAFARYNSNGSLDNTFGNSGKVITDDGNNEYLADMTLQSDGRLLVAATTNSQAFLVYRYDTDGTLDQSFGNGGKLLIPFTDDTGPGSIRVQSDGKIVVGGWMMISNWYVLMVMRYNSDGTTDLGYGTNGIAKIAFPDRHIWANSIAVQTDGKIVAAGEMQKPDEGYGNEFESDIAVARFNPDGTPDQSFGNNGLITGSSDVNEGIYSVAIHTDGTIVGAGYQSSGYSKFAVFRYTASGVPDNSFGDQGSVYTDVDFTGFASSVSVQTDGKIIAVGHRYNISANDFAITRYNVDGSLDGTFGSGGIVTKDFNGQSDALHGAAISGNILYASGYTNLSGIVAAYVLGVNTFYRDADADGFGNSSETIEAAVAPAGYTENSGDCNDNNATVYPGANEGYDGVDNNCNGQVDEGIIVQSAANVQIWSIPSNDPALSISPRDKSLIASGNENYGNDLVGKKLNPLTGSALMPTFPSPGTRNSIWVSTDNPKDVLTGGYAGKAAFKLDGTHIWDAPFFGCCYSIPFSLDLNDKKGWIAINGQFVRIDLLTGLAIQGPYGIEAIGGYSSIVDETTAYIAGQNGSVSKINSSTGQVWNVVIDAGRSLKPGAIANDGSFILTSGNAHEGGLPEAGWLARIQSDGQNVWKQNINAVTYPVIGGNGFIYIGTQTPPVSFNGIGAIKAYLVNGNDLELAWSTPTLGLPNDIVVADNGRLYAVIGNFASGKLLELDQNTGETIRVIDNLPGAWELILQGGVIYTSGVPAYNVAGSITAIPVDANEYDPASPWPVSYHDNQRTGNKTSPQYEVDLTIITCPSDIVQHNDPGQCTANVNPGLPTLASNALELNIVGIRSDNKPLTDPYPFGNTYITWEARDENSVARKSCMQTITIIDNEKPVITSCPVVPVLCYNTDNSYAIPVITATDNCGILNYSFVITGQTSRSGIGNDASGFFNKGTHFITWTVTDGSGNISTCSSTVLINNIDASINDTYTVSPSIGAPNTIYIGYSNTFISLSASAFSNYPVSPFNQFTYKWTIGSPAGPGFATTQSVTVSPAATTTYFVSVKNAYNCSPVAQVSKQVNVVDIRCGAGKILVCEKQRNGSFITKCVSSKNLNLPPGSYLGTCASTTQTNIVNLQPEKEIDEQAELIINASPNPSAGSFNIIVNSNDQKQPVLLKMINTLGQVLITKNNIPAGQTVKIGEELRSGVYIVEAIQGNKRKVLKLIKQ